MLYPPLYLWQPQRLSPSLVSRDTTPAGLVAVKAGASEGSLGGSLLPRMIFSFVLVPNPAPTQTLLQKNIPVWSDEREREREKDRQTDRQTERKNKRMKERTRKDRERQKERKRERKKRKRDRKEKEKER